MKRKLVAVIACRNESSRLFAKPLHYIDVKKRITIIDFIIRRLKKNKCINEIILGISKNKGNEIYLQIAKKFKIKYVLGDDHNVLSRLVACGNATKATDIFRITSESPFTYLENLKKSVKIHYKNNNDATFFDNVIDGCGYEIVNLKSLKISLLKGTKQDRSELCTRYIRCNKNKFKIMFIKCQKYLYNQKLRLTVDNPEDLILCRNVFKIINPNKINFKKVVKFISSKKNKKLISSFVLDGYKSMYL